MANEWLQELEDRVEAAIQEIDRLRRDNKSLKARAEKVTQQLAATKGGAASGGAWQAERAAIRARVEKLVEGLESLAGPAHVL